MAATESRRQGGGPSSNPRGWYHSAPLLHQQPCGLSGTTDGAIRSHWSIENSLHWTLEVTFREDQCRVRKDNGPQNINTLRQIGHNRLKNETTLKVGIQGKRLNASWNENYLLKALLG
jgi:hypothetical protein